MVILVIAIILVAAYAIIMRYLKANGFSKQLSLLTKERLWFAGAVVAAELGLIGWPAAGIWGFISLSHNANYHVCKAVNFSAAIPACSSWHSQQYWAIFSLVLAAGLSIAGVVTHRERQRGSKEGR